MSTARYIFLDQNHWIYLASAASAVWGRPRRDAPPAVSEELLRRVDRDEIRLPLSIIHLIEHMHAEEPGRRQRLAEVCELTVYRDRQWSRSAHENDVRDIGHLAIAVPYCDAVVVERLWARAIRETRLDRKYGVAVSADLADLIEDLDQ